MTTIKLRDRILSAFLCVALLLSCLPLSALQASATNATVVDGTVADPGTAHTWENMLGTDKDGDRYAGRVWADKSVYTNGQTAVLSTDGVPGSTFQVELAENEAFQIIFSALGSSMTSISTVTSAPPMDVVLVLDNSVSMNTTSGGTTRMQKVIEAANKLLDNLLSNGNDVRLGITAYSQDAAIVLPFGKYTDGVELRVNRYTGTGSSNGVITAYNSNNQVINRNYKSNGYANYTNTQEGFDLAMDMLENATGTQGRNPVVILLTDGAANTALDTLFDNDKTGTVRQVYYSNNIDPMIALSTLLSAAYNKASVKSHYGIAPMVYGIGVDLSSSDGSNAIIDPAKNFNSSNSNANIRSAYQTYTSTWLAGRDVSVSSGTGNTRYTFKFGHEYPQGSGITDKDIAANINYVDSYYPVASADLESVFQQIYNELVSSAFNPISSSTTVNGATGVDNTPLIYVDFIGQHMEVKDIQAVTLFGASYDVIKNADGTYTVEAASGINPTTNERYNTSEDIKIDIITQEDGSQKLEIRINQEILPILLEQVVSNTVNDVTSATINQLTYHPLRVYYTVGLASDILLDNGQVDVTKLRNDYPYINDATGQISFYSNTFGNMQPVQTGDAHVGFQPSAKNRYYYHQKNQGIFSSVTRTDRSDIHWEEDAYGVAYKEGDFELTWLSYEEYLTLQDDSEVYTYVTYHRPTDDTTDAANTAEEVTYLVFTKWGYLKESVAFYDDTTGKYVNYDAATGTYSLDDVGYVVSADHIAAYVAANPNAKLYAVLGVGSLRTSRLHNMMVEKDENPTDSADQRYTPEYTYETAAIHNGNSVVVWLGNNGRLTTTIHTGIALTKNVTETMGSPDDTYALTVTLPAGVSANPAVKDAQGADVPFTFENQVITVQVKAGQTVYVTGIPAGTLCTIGETIHGDYYIADATATVTIPSLSEVLADAPQYVPATVTNAPNKYGNLIISKDIAHHLEATPEAMAQKVFTFQVQLPAALAGRTYAVDNFNTTAFLAETVTVGDDGSFTVTLKDNESISILDLPEGTTYTVTEIDSVAGYQNTTGTIAGLIPANADALAHFVNTYGTTPANVHIIVTGTKTLLDIHDTYEADEDFVFVLSQYVGGNEEYKVLDQAAVKAGERYTFALTTTLDLGTYYFRVTEESGATAGMTYDATRGLFAVHVTDENADGALEYTVENFANTEVTATDDGFTVTKDFTNTYNVETTFADIQIEKILHNNTGVQIPLDLFHFQLVSNDDPNPQPITATTDASGKATIRIAELKEGVYRYTLSEVDGGLPGMTYDPSSYAVQVTVTKEDDRLVAVATIDGVGDSNTVSVSFENTYALTETHYTPGGEKVITGPTSVENHTFSFLLYQVDSSFEVTGEPLETVNNLGNVFNFSKITYTQVGTYYYVIEEAAGTQAGMQYDTTHYHVTVTVDVDPQDPSALAVTDVSLNKIGVNSDHSGKVVFVNSYTVKETQYSISGTKFLSGRAIAAGEFAFELYEGETLLETVSVQANGNFTFSAITYAVPGVHVYTVKEVVGSTPGVTYDATVYTITVTVTDENSQLVATADISNDDIVFHNVYTAKPATVTFSGSKTLVGGALVDGMFSFHLYQTGSTFRIYGDPVSVTKNSNGIFTFEELTFTEAGNYFFVVVESNEDPIDGIVYDRTQHCFHVQVRDAGDGQLRVTVHNLDADTHTTPAASASISVDFINATFGSVTEKEVYDANVTTMIDGQQVAAGDVLTYLITYTNYTGRDAMVTIKDTIPTYTTYVEGSASHNGTYAGGYVNWILKINKGESVTVTFQVKVDEVDDVQITNQAVVIEGGNTYTTNEVTNRVPKLPEPEPTEPEPTEPEPTEPEPTEPEPTEPEPTEPGPTEPEPTEPEPTEPEPTKPGPTEPEPTEPEPTEPEPTEPEPTEPEPTEPEPTEPEPTEPTDPEPTEPEPDLPPKTGDPTSLSSWFAALFVSGGGVISTVIYGKKKKEQD